MATFHYVSDRSFWSCSTYNLKCFICQIFACIKLLPFWGKTITISKAGKPFLPTLPACCFSFQTDFGSPKDDHYINIIVLILIDCVPIFFILNLFRRIFRVGVKLFKKNANSVREGGHFHFWPSPKFPRFFVWKTSLTKHFYIKIIFSLLAIGLKIIFFVIPCKGLAET